MEDNKLVAVTGAFGYTGKYITRQLLKKGNKVITLTGRPDRPNEFGDTVKAYPFDFDNPERLVQHLHGVQTLYNTYWVRFNHGKATFDRAVANTLILIDAAKAAGVERLVHVSITNPSIHSPLPYFRGKARLEDAINKSGLSYAIIRPTVIFGREDILINNIAYLLRVFPLFVIPGSGEYRLQPIFVEDMAKLCVQSGDKEANLVTDAVGPEIFTFNELVTLINQTVGGRAKIAHLPQEIALALARLIGLWMKDVVLTSDEISGLSSNLLISNERPTGATRLGDWLWNNRDWVGHRYASELKRHYEVVKKSQSPTQANLPENYSR